MLKPLELCHLIEYLLGCPRVNPGCVPTRLAGFVPAKWPILASRTGDTRDKRQRGPKNPHLSLSFVTPY